jgi:hypothetical protein
VSIQDDAVDADTGFGVPSLSLTRYITNGFSIGAQYSLNSLDIKNANIDFSSLDAIVKYNLVEGDFLPYLFGGYGLSNFNKDFSFSHACNNFLNFLENASQSSNFFNVGTKECSGNFILDGLLLSNIDIYNMFR